jgi:hypothetical protein
MAVSKVGQLEEERIGKYKVHPVAALFPLLEGDDFDDLVENIRAYGQKIPITVHEDVLLDGRNRLRACLALDMSPLVEQYNPRVNEEPGDWIVSMNIHRRNLDADKRATLWIEANDLMKALRQEAAARMQTGKSEDGTAGGRGRKKNPERNPAQGFRAPQTRDRIAATVGVSRDKVDQALAVKQHAPELLKEIKTGKIKLKDAARVARKRAVEQKPPRKTKPRKSRPVDLEKVLRREVAHFERTRASLPERMRDDFLQELIRTLERL